MPNSSDIALPLALITLPTIPTVLILPLSLPLFILIIVIDLLLQHDAVHAGLEQGAHGRRLALQEAQAVERHRGRVAGEVVQGGC